MRKYGLLAALPLVTALMTLAPSSVQAQQKTGSSPKPIDENTLPITRISDATGYDDPIPESSKLAPLPKDTLSLSQPDSLPFSKNNPFSQHPQIDTLVTQWAQQSPDRNALVEAVNKLLQGQKPLGKLFVDNTHIVKPDADLYASFITAEDSHGKVQTGARVTFHNTSLITVQKYNIPANTLTTTTFSFDPTKGGVISDTNTERRDTPRIKSDIDDN